MSKMNWKNNKINRELNTFTKTYSTSKKRKSWYKSSKEQKPAIKDDFLGEDTKSVLYDNAKDW